MEEEKQVTRKDWLSSVLMWIGLGVSYGTIGVQGLLYLIPKSLRPSTRKLFVGRIEQFPEGGVSKFYDLEGSEILIRRTEATKLEAFSSTCPHLGCKVRWEADQERFFCPCHRGVFDASGVATAGPPADGGQNMIRVPLDVDQKNGVVYIEVKDASSKKG